MEEKIDWKRKLSSRKFWALIAGFISPLLMAINVPENEVARAVSIMMAGASVIAYIIGESWVDSARENSACFGSVEPLIIDNVAEGESQR